MNCPGVIYISVSADGAVSVNRKPTPFEELNRTLERLQPTGKSLFYYRENIYAEPTGSRRTRIKAIFDAVRRLQLPISLSSRPDFSDVIDGSGRIQPRRSCAAL